MSDEQKEQKKTRKAARPRLDAIVRHIVAGSYDDELDKIDSALDRRRQKLQGDLLEKVKKVFGKDATVSTSSQERPPKPIERPNPFLSKQGGPTDEELKAAEEAALARERELAAEAGGLPDDDDDPDIESRSPIIGSVET
jgi:hypothetical protein